jgi:putative PIN family toxin of toxin-antitoxin system
MGQKTVKPRKVVLDTNVLVSALLFSGSLSELVDLWKHGKILPVFSDDTLREFTKTLAYPKFSLARTEIRKLIDEEIVPYFEFTDVTTVINDVCPDPDDDKFLSCALSASAEFIVSGDKALQKIGQFRKIKIITPHRLLQILKRKVSTRNPS